MTETEQIQRWLRRQATVEELASFKSECREWARPRAEYGKMVDLLLAELATGGELWRFRSSTRSWAGKCGRAGWAVVKDGKVVAHIVTMMN